MKKPKILKQFMKGNLFKYFTAILFSGVAVIFSIITMVISFTIDSVVGRTYESACLDFGWLPLR